MCCRISITRTGLFVNIDSSRTTAALQLPCRSGLFHSPSIPTGVTNMMQMIGAARLKRAARGAATIMVLVACSPQILAAQSTKSPPPPACPSVPAPEKNSGTAVPELERRLEGAMGWYPTFRIFPIEKPIQSEEWMNPTPIALCRFVLVSRGRGSSFYVTFAVAESDERAHAMLGRYQGLIQMGAKMSKEFGTDELVSWPTHLAGRWGHTVANVSTDERDPTPEEWSSVMGIVDRAMRGQQGSRLKPTHP
jgi:hypothetical protein